MRTQTPQIECTHKDEIIANTKTTAERKQKVKHIIDDQKIITIKLKEVSLDLHQEKEEVINETHNRKKHV